MVQQKDLRIENIAESSGILQYAPSGLFPADAEIFCNYGRGRCRQDLGFVRSYIANHYPENLTVEKLAALIGVTPSHLGRLFRRSEGIGIRAFIEITRLERAAALLRGTGRPIRDIAGTVGFSDESYFCLRFRAVFGKTPGAYRKTCRESHAYDHGKE